MLWIGGKKPGRIYIGSRAVAALYVGARLVWQAVRSCFGSGRWVSRKPWLGKERWKNN
ncbi:MAG: MFS transporter [Muribaculaceae bacterium]|nr:MFS transporter [Muribaculaceae bacterium]